MLKRGVFYISVLAVSSFARGAILQDTGILPPRGARTVPWVPVPHPSLPGARPAPQPATAAPAGLHNASLLRLVVREVFLQPLSPYGTQVGATGRGLRQDLGRMSGLPPLAQSPLLSFAMTAKTAAGPASPLGAASHHFEAAAPGYTAQQKRTLLQGLVPERLAARGLSVQDVVFTADALDEMMRYDTAGPGMALLLQKTEEVLARALAAPRPMPVRQILLRAESIRALLGAPQPQPMDRKYPTFLTGPPAQGLSLYLRTRIGEANGLYAVPCCKTGGLSRVYAVTRPHAAEALESSGSMDAVMRESVITARTYILGVLAFNLKKLGHPAAFAVLQQYRPQLLHVGFQQDGMAKSGPSAGVPITLSILSRFTGLPVRGDVAMTGAITPAGDVTVIGGIREKIIAAQRAGIRKVLFPVQNVKDLDADFMRNVTIDLVGIGHIEEAIRHALVLEGTR